MKPLRLLASGLTPVILIGAVVAAGAWMGRASHTKKAKAEQQAQQQTIATVPVTQGDFEVVVEAIGKLEAIESRSVMAEVSGQIVSLVPNGSRVREGDVIAVLDVPRMVRQLRDQDNQYRDALVRLESRKRELAADVERAQITLDQAEKELARFRAAQEVELTTKRRQTEFDAQDLDINRARFDRKSKLAAEKLLPAHEVELATADLKAKEFGLERERKDLDLAEAKKSSDELDKLAAVNRAKADLARAQQAQQFELSNAMMAVEVSRQQLARVQEQLAKAQIRAPADGILVLEQQRQFRGGGAQRTLEPGDPVWEGMKIATVPDLSQMRVVVALPQEQARLVKRKQPVVVRVDALPGKTFRGRVSEISQTAKESDLAGVGIPSGERTFEARIDVDTGRGFPKPRPAAAPEPPELGPPGEFGGAAWPATGAVPSVPAAGGRAGAALSPLVAPARGRRGGSGQEVPRTRAPDSGGRGPGAAGAEGGGPGERASLREGSSPSVPGAEARGEGGGRRRRGAFRAPEGTAGGSGQGVSRGEAPGLPVPEGEGRGRGRGRQEGGSPSAAEATVGGGRGGLPPLPALPGGLEGAGWGGRGGGGLPPLSASPVTGAGRQAGLAAQLPGSVSISPWSLVASPSRLSQARPQRETQSTPLRPGMTAQVRIIVERIPEAISVPLECVFTQDERKYVYVERNHRFQAVEVELGPQNADMVVVKRGLRVGERVALRDVGERGAGTEAGGRKQPAPSILPL